MKGTTHNGKQLVSVVLAAKKTGLKLLTTVLLVSAIPIQQALAQVDYSQLVDIPPPSELNPGLASPSASYMESVLGVPGELTEDCSEVTNPELQQQIVTQNVGPFTVTGYRPAVEALGRIFAAVEQEKPELYSQLETAGMLCVRQIRGGSGFSNHSWGTAIDIKINGQLDKVGDGKTQLGLRELSPYFHNEGFYWGAAYSGGREDSMHFEASEQLITKWTEDGTPTPPSSPILQEGAIVSLQNQGNIEGPRFLDGRTADGTVGLAPNIDGVFTGTKWKVHVINDKEGIVALENQGNIEGSRFLDGRTAEGTLGLAPTTEGQFTGTKWKVNLAQ
jgi:hypothetical protein